MLSIRVLAAAAAVAFLLLALGGVSSVPEQTRFTDQSEKGLAIVPASGSSCNSSPSASVYDACPGDMCFNLDGVQGGPPGGYYLYETYGVYRNCCPNGYVADVASCYAPCGLPWGGSITHGASVTAYQSASVAYGSSCVSQTRTCSNGSLSGSYVNSACTVEARPAPTCSISLNPTTINQGSASTISWNSTNADSFYISNLSYVTPNTSGGTSVGPSSSTGYNGTVVGNGTAYCSATLTVNQSCTFNGSTITHGNSVTAYQAASVPFGSSCVSETRSCSNGSLSGSYAHASCSVSAAANCTLDGVTVNHGNSRTFYAQQTATGGALCSSYALSRTCTNGSLSGSASYQYANCSCAAAYTCSGSDIRFTNASCSTSTVATCTAPLFCSAGFSSCQAAEIGFTPTPGVSLSGHLQARPAIISEGDRTRLYWNVANAASCAVSGGGQNWTGLASGGSGVLTNAIAVLTRYTLTCEALGENEDVVESIDVLVVPDFSET